MCISSWPRSMLECKSTNRKYTVLPCSFLHTLFHRCVMKEVSTLVGDFRTHEGFMFGRLNSKESDFEGTSSLAIIPLFPSG